MSRFYYNNQYPWALKSTLETQPANKMFTNEVKSFSKGYLAKPGSISYASLAYAYGNINPTTLVGGYTGQNPNKKL